VLVRFGLKAPERGFVPTASVEVGEALVPIEKEAMRFACQFGIMADTCDPHEYSARDEVEPQRPG
jgi:hypothetical protein